LLDDLAQKLCAKAAFAARARLILQCPKPASEISPPPLRDLVTVHTDLLPDGTHADSFSRQLHDSRPLCQPLRGTLGADQLPQLLSLSGTQHQLSTMLGHPNTQAHVPKNVTII